MVQNYTFVEGSLDEVVAEFARSSVVALDLETTGLSPLDSRIVLCQLGFPGSTFVIDASKVDLHPLLPFFKDRKWTKLIQQSKFERKFIQHFYNTQINEVFDTYLAENLISTSQFGASLASLATKYTDMTLNKAIRTSFTDARSLNVFSSEQLQYAADDVIVLLKIYEAQQNKIKETNQEKVADLEFELATVVANMELVGVPIDQKKWLNILAQTQAEHEQTRLRLNALLFDEGKNVEQMGMFVRDGINLNSVPQIKRAFQNLGIEITTTNEREIGLIDHPAAKELLKYRGLQKILSAYGTSFLDHIHPFTGRIHADFRQIGTETGRFSCKEPNLQQMPDNFRQCVGGGSNDFSIIAADYSQIELRILAELSQDPNFLAAFNSGEDLHRATAATMFNIPAETVTKEQRFIAKTINFGLAYGMGANKLRDILNAEAEKNGTAKYGPQQTKNLVSKYRKAYQNVIWWLDDNGALAVRKGYSETMYGRKRFFTRPAQGIPEEDFEQQMASIRRQGANSPIQGTNADLTKLAMIDIQRELKNNGFSADIIIQVHDEIVVLARKDEAAAVKDIVVQSMIDSAQVLLKTVPVKVEAYVNSMWKKA